MSLFACTTATSTDGAVSDTASLRALLGATSTEHAVVAYQTRLIARASQWAAQQLGYPLHVATYQETLPSYGGRTLMLGRTPLRTVLRFFETTSTGTATEYCSTHYRIADPDAGLLTRDQGWQWTAGSAWGLDSYPENRSESEPWLMEYVAGWVYPGLSTDSPNYSTCGPLGTTSTERTLPEDIEHAVLLKAAEWHQAPAGNISSQTIGDLSITYANTQGTYRSESDALLDPYRRM